MTLSPFAISMIDGFNIIPAAAMCFYPMKNQNRFSWKRTIISSVVFLSAAMVINAFISAYILPGYNATLFVLLSATFAFFCYFFKASFAKKLFVFLLVCSTISFVSNISNGFDAILHPTSNVNNFSSEAAIFQAVLSTIVALISCYPATKYLGALIDDYNVDITWYIISVVAFFFMGFNFVIIPTSYDVLYQDHIFAAYWGLIAVMLTLMIALCVIFTSIIRSALQIAKDAERLSLLEMQDAMYKRLQQYMDDTRRERHDFRHTIRTLTTMANDGDLSGLKEYLSTYSEKLPENMVSRFTENVAANALLNFYKDYASGLAIPLTWEIDLPGNLGAIPDSDFCSILGNLLDNAIIACKTIPDGDRFIDLSIRCENNATIYIAVANSFNGVTRLRNGVYRSTHKHGSGIGLESVKVTSERYKGAASFSHEDKEFYSEVMLSMI